MEVEAVDLGLTRAAGGDVTEIRLVAEAWRAAGVGIVILVPSSTRGNQMVAFEEILAAFR